MDQGSQYALDKDMLEFNCLETLLTNHRNLCKEEERQRRKELEFQDIIGM